MSESEEEVLFELGDANIEFIPNESNFKKQLLLFKIVDTIGDESISLANICVMFRGDLVNILKIDSIKLALFNKDTHLYAQIGLAKNDDSDDLRIFQFPEWLKNVPLPLGNDLLEKLRIIIKLDSNLTFDTNEEIEFLSSVKFSADIVPFPEIFLQNNPKLKRKMNTSIIKFKGGAIIDIEDPIDAFTSKPITSTSESEEKEESKEKFVKKMYWWNIDLNHKQSKKRITTYDNDCENKREA